MDGIDRRILMHLQEDGSLGAAELAERVGLSATPCWRRVQKLEAAGIIRKRVALLDREKINLGVVVFVAVRTDQHSLDWLTRFAEAIRDIPEILEAYRIAGDIDYLLRIVVPDIAAYDAVYKRLIARLTLADVSSMFAMEELKATTALPVTYASSGA